MVWIDSLTIPADAPHPENALAYIDYLLDSQVAAQNAAELHVASPNKEALQTGMIPADALADTVMGRGAPGALDSVVVRWGGGGDLQGGESVLAFKSYEKGREKWQGETLHGVWFDEEPPLDIYSEGLTRTNATGGITIVTFTPLLGMSDVVLRFLSAGEVERIGKG